MKLMTLCALATILATSALPVSAQVIAYRHRSTAYGDHLAGTAELVRASGLAARDHAEAYATLIQAERAREELRQERLRAYFYEQEYREEQFRAKAAERRQQQAQDTANEQSAALDLLRQYQLGTFFWPSALQRPEFANSTRLIESILSNWSPDAGQSFTAYRRALATEAGVLRNRLSDPRSSIPFEHRLTAVRTLKSLQLLASLENAQATVEGEHLASR